LLDNTIGGIVITEENAGIMPEWRKRYEDKYKVLSTWEASLHYSAMRALALAVAKSGNPDDPRAIRAAFPQIYPLIGGKIPGEFYGISPEGAQYSMSGVQMIKGGKYTPAEYYVWWANSQSDVDAVKKLTQENPNLINWLKLK